MLLRTYQIAPYGVSCNEQAVVYPLANERVLVKNCVRTVRPTQSKRDAWLGGGENDRWTICLFTWQMLYQLYETVLTLNGAPQF